MEYAQSEVTKMLTLQTREFYNEIFKKFYEGIDEIFAEDYQMSEEDYDRLKERYIKKVSYLHHI